uniref:Conserved hypothetical plastid protein n=1 Tax=Corallina ferreyrae TaxID=2547422 RepID=A0A482CJW1_9FLOR|nr:conserved hypothetical plastid protein [Corallina ferreyrae]QBL75581.1 conserved hypothetical plastid protein [Corallina ferreyrae]
MTNVINNNLEILRKIANLEDYFSINQQIELVKQISEDQFEAFNLLEFLIERRIRKTTKLSYIDGIIFKSLYNSQIISLQETINTYFKEGVVQLESSNNINYNPLFQSLISNNFREANFLTQIYLQELAGLKKNNKRQWLYFTDILKIPSKDLKTIDTLWRIYSEGKFGFSIQKQIWIYNNKNWDKLWHMIGWKVNNTAVRYPNEFIWDHKAPKGHLPLFNQLRGVQVIASLFKHPALKK